MIGPVTTPAGTTAPMVVLLLTTKPDALVPLKETAVAPVKLLPVILTVEPAALFVGVKLVIDGGR